jgi:hypothetical protein
MPAVRRWILARRSAATRQHDFAAPTVVGAAHDDRVVDRGVAADGLLNFLGEYLLTAGVDDNGIAPE